MSSAHVYPCIPCIIVFFKHSNITILVTVQMSQKLHFWRRALWRHDRWCTSPGHIALSWSLCSGPLPKFQKQYQKLKLWILEISMQPAFYYLAFCIANHFILSKSTRKQVNDPHWQKSFNSLWISQYFNIG